MIIVDYSGIAMAALFAHGKPDGMLDESFIRHMILNSLRMYNSKFRKEYGQMVIAVDGGSWRRDVFPAYKGRRREAREDGESTVDWKAFFETLNKVRDEITENLPFKVVRVDKAEADDVIGVLVESTQDFGFGEPVMIVSSDKDFKQLHRYDNVRQFSPMLKKFIDEKNPVRFLREQILRGDGGDGIPNILSPDDIFMTEGGRQTPLTAKKIEQYLVSWDKLETILPTKEARNLHRNKMVIDLSQTPQEIKDKIMETYKACPTPSNAKVFNYLVSKRCVQLASSAEEFFVTVK